MRRLLLLVLLSACDSDNALKDVEEDEDGDGFDDEEDCDDNDDGVNPDADELIADGLDQDCDGLDLCHVDDDGDGYGAEALLPADCDTEGAADNAEDCDDTDPGTSPGASELPADGVDQDCDGVESCFTDADGDGFGGDALVQSVDLRCDAVGLVPFAGDCDDFNADVYPDTTEVPGDGVDQDCDGGERCYSDADGDGYGAAPELDSVDPDCSDPGEADDLEDCLDTDAATFPGAAPADSPTACMTDADADGYGSGDPEIGVSAGSDCDDDDVSLPPCPPRHVGNDVEFADASTHGANYLLGSPLTLVTSMTVTDLGLIGKSATGNVRMALYSDLRGEPYTLLLESSTAPVLVGVEELPVPSTPLLPGDYWIMGIFDVTASIGIDYGDAGAVVMYRSHSFSDPLPSPFGPPAEYTGQQFNYYIVGY